MSALGLATIGVQCDDRALGMASMGLFCVTDRKSERPGGSSGYLPSRVEDRYYAAAYREESEIEEIITALIVSGVI